VGGVPPFSQRQRCPSPFAPDRRFAFRGYRKSMSSYSRHEIAVGVFVILGGLALAYLSVQLGGLNVLQTPSAHFTARFSSVGSLKPGDPVKIAGVSVGSVESVQLVNYQAEATFALTTPVAIPKDSIASIQSAGLLGDAYVSISPGASDEDLASGERIVRTEPAISLTELIGKYAFGSPADPDSGNSKASAEEPEASPSPFVDPLAPKPAAAEPSAAEPTSGSGDPAPPSDSSPIPQPKKSVFKDPLE